MNVGTFYKCNKCGCKTNAGIKVGDYVICSNCLAHKKPIIPNKNENQKAIECLEDVKKQKGGGNKMREILEEVFKKMQDKGLDLNDENNNSAFVELLNKEMYELQLSNKNHRIAILEKALRMKLEEDWIGCPDYVINDEFNFCVEKAEKELKEKADEKN